MQINSEKSKLPKSWIADYTWSLHTICFSRLNFFLQFDTMFKWENMQIVHFQIVALHHNNVSLGVTNLLDICSHVYCASMLEHAFLDLDKNWRFAHIWFKNIKYTLAFRIRKVSKLWEMACSWVELYYLWFRADHKFECLSI